MFINCTHCRTLVATDPATDLPPERCPRCGGVLRVAQAVAEQAPADVTPVSEVPAAPTPSPAPAPVETTLPPPAPMTAAPLAAAAVPAAGLAAPATPPATAEAAPAAAATTPVAPANDASPAAADASTGPEPAGVAIAAPPAAPQARPAATTTAPTEQAGAATAPPPAADARDPAADAPPTDETPATPAIANTTAPPPRPAFLAKPPPAAAVDGKRRWRLPAAIAALVLLLGLQVVLADRDRLAADPQWRPLVASVCGLFGCSLAPWHEPGAFVLLARDVRPHPDAAGALRVRASFRNDARWPQAWPWLLLTLSDVDGRAVAARAFDAGEYLAASPAGTVVEPGQTVDIALDIREPSEATVSYAFDFR